MLLSQGPGFAVVASEVRTLASRSAQAAKEIEGLISESVRLIDLGSDEVATAGKIMCTIVDEMDKVTQQNASLVEEASTAAVSLEEQAARLTEAVDVFRLNKHSVSAEPRGACEPVSFATV